MFIVLFVYRSEGRDPNRICYPCVMGWGLAGPGNSSAVAVAAAVAAAPSQNVCFLRKKKAPAGTLVAKPGFLREKKGPCGHAGGDSGILRKKNVQFK